MDEADQVLESLRESDDNTEDDKGGVLLGRDDGEPEGDEGGAVLGSDDGEQAENGDTPTQSLPITINGNVIEGFQSRMQPTYNPGLEQFRVGELCLIENVDHGKHLPSEPTIPTLPG